MNANAQLAINVMKNPNSQNLSKFILKLSNTERNNFMRPNTNKSAWIQRWLNNRYPNVYKRYLNSLKRIKNANMTINNYSNYVMLRIGNEPKGYIAIEPLCSNNKSKGVFIAYGATFPNFRGQRIGYRLRKAAVNAARNSKTRLYQVAQNIEHLVNKNNLPISGRIMRSLGAIQVNTPPPCHQLNTKGPKSYVFMFNGTVNNKKLTSRPSLRKRV